MPEGDASTGSGPHRPEHQFWLTMRAAHAQWANATEALDYLIAAASTENPSPDERLRVARAAEEQRARFEEYIEARLAFSEFQSAQFQAVQVQSARDRAVVAEAAGGEDGEQRFHEVALGPWTLRATSRFAMAALGIALLCPAVFGLTYVMHERKHVRDLDAARDAMSALLTQARSQTQLAVQQASRVPVPRAGASRERPCAEDTGERQPRAPGTGGVSARRAPRRRRQWFRPTRVRNRRASNLLSRLPCATRVSGRSACRCTISIASTTASISP